MAEEDPVKVNASHEFKDFYTKIVGVTAKNADGVSRQTVIQTLRIGQKLHLQREPGNPHDPEAIRVITPKRVVVGYIHAKMANDLAPVIDAGYRFSVVVSSLTGGDADSFGVNIRVRSLGRTAAPRQERKSGCLSKALMLLVSFAFLAGLAWFWWNIVKR